MSSVAAFVVAVSAIVGQAEDNQEKLTPGQEHMQELQFLIGTGESGSESGKVTPVKCEWINNKSYIMLVAGDYREIFGWDLRGQEIVSWVFGTHGGQGKFSWTKEGDTWKGKAKTPFLDRWGNEYADSRTLELVGEDAVKATWRIKGKDGEWKTLSFVSKRLKPKKAGQRKAKKAKQQK